MTAIPIPSKKWMTMNRASLEYRNGVQSFITFTKAKLGADKDWYICHCAKCKNERTNQTSEKLEEHLICNGIDKSYKIWYLHGEPFPCRAGTSIAGTAPTQASQERVATVQALLQQDTSSCDRDLDRNTVAQVCCTDNRGRTRGVGSVPKTVINVAARYRDELLQYRARDMQADFDQATLPSHQTASSSFSAGPAPPGAKCALKVSYGVIVAVAEFLSVEPDWRCLLNVKLKIVGVASTPMFVGEGILGTRSVGEVIKWPGFYVQFA